MSSLAKDAAKFKAALHRQDYTSWHTKSDDPSPATPKPSQVKADPDADYVDPTSATKKPRPKSNIVYSQPADTGSGLNVNTQLVYAIEHLKSRPGPMRLQDLAIITDTPIDRDQVLLQKFKSHDRVQWDSKTDLYSYKHDFNFRNKPALLTEIQRHTRKGGGIPVRALKESWKEAPAAIEELEKDGDVLVTRTQKDGTLKMVFYNEIKPTEDSGGMHVDQEFRDIWHGLKVPNDVDLLRQLTSEGLQVTAAQGKVQKAPTTTKKGKKKGSAPRTRQAKITNTHLRGMDIDLSKDYTPAAK